MTFFTVISGWQILFVGCIIFIIPIIALIDILRSEFEGNNKLIWTLVVLFTGVLGAVLYYLMGRKQKIYSAV